MSSPSSNSGTPPFNHPLLRLFLKRLASGLAVLIGVAFLTLLGLFMAQQGRLGLPADILTACLEALRQLSEYLFNHPQTYVWHREIVPAFELVSTLFMNSAILLVLSLAVATLLGGGFGILAAQLRNRNLGPWMVLISILGISTPSFLLGMLFWIANVQLYRLLGLNKALLPQVGFGWDLHLVMPVLVLAARPFAQILQVTYVNMSRIFNEDFMRVARGKGVPYHLQVSAHALRNVLIPTLTTLGTSLRFSLASLPVVESFFDWPGIGLSILEAIQLDMTPLITDLTVSLGLMFLIINLSLEFIFPLIDPRLRRSSQESEVQDELAWRGHWGSMWEGVVQWFRDASQSLQRRAQLVLNPPAPAAPSPGGVAALPGQVRVNSQEINSVATDTVRPGAYPSSLRTSRLDEEIPYASNARLILKDALTNAPLMIGGLVVLAFLGLAIFGRQLTTADPYETHGVMLIEGIIYGPPFPPSSVFPWGSDAVGRDVQAMVLAGARQTLSLALFGMIARVLVGVSLGMLAGWWQRSWLDQLINAVISIWAAFPVTLFAMILILGMGIERGMSVFVIALCVVGWGEIAQYVRGEVIGQKPQLYIESARAVGADSSGILVRHILPHLLPTVIVLSIMEMGAILMLLAELGFLSIYLGGGFTVELMGVGRYAYSDVPEWGSMLANIRNWWRSYPWMAWYPGGLFFLAILSFNLWGEGLRRFLAESRLSLNRFINRYTLIAGLVVVIGSVWAVRSQAPMELYKSQARLFDAERAMQDLTELTSPAYMGRESGTPADWMAAEYIAAQMDEIGLLPAGEKGSFIQGIVDPRFQLSRIPTLKILDAADVADLAYREDFVERISSTATYGEGQGPLVGLALGQGQRVENVSVNDYYLADKILLVREEDLPHLDLRVPLQGLLVITPNPDVMVNKYLSPFYGRPNYPQMYVTPEAADQLLASAGSSLAKLADLSADLPADQVYMTEAGYQLFISVTGDWLDRDLHNNSVIGYIAGSGALSSNPSQASDSQVIIVSAYFDGLGVGPDGVLYPGANNNASGVATLLEIARAIKSGSYPPEKTILFVAWSGGNRFSGLNVFNTMNAKTGFGRLTVEAVIELSGVGYGTGAGLALDQASSYRLAGVIQDAAERSGVQVTNRGRGPHFGIPQPISGNRTALSAFVSWDGSDNLAHTPSDTIEIIDPQKLQSTGEVITLAVTVLSRETNY